MSAAEPDTHTRTQHKWSLTSFLLGRLQCFPHNGAQIKKNTQEGACFCIAYPKAAVALSGRRLKGDIALEMLLRIHTPTVHYREFKTVKQQNPILEIPFK